VLSASLKIGKNAEHYLEPLWVVCTLPERAFVRLLTSSNCVSSEVYFTLASSALPYRRSPPSWLKTTPDEVVELIIKLARKGLTPSQIGVTLRDSNGIPQVRFVTGNKILRILKSNGVSATSLHIVVDRVVVLTGAVMPRPCTFDS
jgi:hypothetical protein